MAKTRETIFKVKYVSEGGEILDKQVKSLEEAEQAVKDLEAAASKADFGSQKWKDLKEGAKDAADQIEDAKIKSQSFGETVTNLPGPLGSLAQGVKGVGTAMKALAANPLLAVLTLLVAALTAVFKAFTSTKEGAETLQRFTAGLGAAFDVLRDLIVKVTKPLMKVFTDPKQALIDFGNLLKEQIINRFVGMLELIPNIGKAIGLLFKGEFSEAAKVATDAVGKVTLGVENVTDKAAEAFGELSDAAKEAVREAQEAARLTGVLQDIADKERDLKVARAEQNKELEKTKLQVEDTNLSLGERIAALDKITAAENEQLELELQLERQRLAALEALAAMSDSDAETLDKLAEQRIRLAQLEQESFAKQTSVATKRISLINQEKAEREAAAKAYQAIEDQILQKRQENILASIEDERERALKTLEFQKDADLKSIAELEATEEQKNKLRKEAEEKYQREVAAVEEQELERKADLERRVRELTAESYEEQLQLAVEAEQEKFNALIEEAEGNTALILELEKAREDAVTQLKIDAARERGQKLKDLELEIQAAIAMSEAEQVAAQRARELEDTARYYDELIRQAEEQNMDTTALNAAKNAKLKEQNDQYRQQDLAAEAAAYEAKASVTMAYLALASQAASLLSDLAGENKKLQIAAIGIEKAAAIGQILVSTGVANAKALAASPLTGGMPWVAINNISAGLAVASTIAAGAKAIAEINKADTSTDSKDTKSSVPRPSKFRKGGLLGGKLHKEGGVMSPFGELEGGEFVVNRASTANFLPMLEKINSLGQGLEMSRGNMSSQQEMSMMGQQTPIIKTYVVASDVSSQQEADKRIRDIASL